MCVCVFVVVIVFKVFIKLLDYCKKKHKII